MPVRGGREATWHGTHCACKVRKPWAATTVLLEDGVFDVSLGEKAGVHGDRLATRDRVMDDSYAEGQHMR